MGAAHTFTTGALFDLDGVLWDTTPVHKWAFDEVCALEGIPAVDYAAIAGRPTPAAWAIVLQAENLPVDPGRIARLTQAKQAMARARLEQSPPLCPGAASVATVSRQPARRLGLGLVTGASAASTNVFLRASGIEFDAVITGESVTQGKPSPMPYLAAASVLGLAPGHCWAIDDSASGLESALAAGVRTVHLKAPGESCPPHPKVSACLADIEVFLRLIMEDGNDDCRGASGRSRDPARQR